MSNTDIGMIGLGVMGSSLARNMASKGFAVSCYDWDESLRKKFAGQYTEGFVHAANLKEFVESIAQPRKIMMMIKAGAPVDSVLKDLVPLLAPGDMVIDGGNSQWQDTERRVKSCTEHGLLYVGSGVSGGEEGALKGPALMPGGNVAAWEGLKPIFQKISAHTAAGEPCCDWVGDGGAGHFVKMVHNGIEYGDMQLICETYQLMKEGLGLSNEEMHEVFKEWNEGDLDSYLIEITRDILGFKNEQGEAVVDKILDTAGQKGTGKWTAISALDLGQPLTLIGEAVFARCLSALKDERTAASKVLSGPGTAFSGDKAALVADLKQALYASKIISYAQGYQLMRAAAEEYGWKLNSGGIASIWRGGCIIRSAFLGKIKDAYDANPDLENLLLDPFFASAVENAQAAWRRVVVKAVELGIPMPAIGAALSFYDGYRSEHLPANLLQAQRDYFGAHTYERVDRPRGEFFHTQWI
ncbi:MAG: decarboxylating NADP(+)-dependent phosphogluconate dehydrogenase [Kiritimatiellales bacterium]|nr:decarboxylating NADP(+)-dependent phosphogluconate dehydrogenase [Kiritimatiellales bacterium]